MAVSLDCSMPTSQVILIPPPGMARLLLALPMYTPLLVLALAAKRSGFQGPGSFSEPLLLVWQPGTAWPYPLLVLSLPLLVLVLSLQCLLVHEECDPREHPLLLSCTPEPVFSEDERSLAPATPRRLHLPRTQSKLTFSLDLADTDVLTTPRQVPPVRKSFVSRLSSSLARLRTAAASFTTLQMRHQEIMVALTLAFTPRSTDDRLPHLHTHREPPREDVPLATFRVAEQPLTAHHTLALSRRKLFGYVPQLHHKLREPRINLRFLRLYAHDCAAKLQGLLVPHAPDLPEGVLADHEAMVRGDRVVLTQVLREKLWNNVVLPPRDDMPCDNSHTRTRYVYVGDDGNSRIASANNARTRTQGGLVPWASALSHTLTCVKPTGYLTPQLQFTVKGWANPRWVSLE